MLKGKSLIVKVSFSSSITYSPTLYQHCLFSLYIILSGFIPSISGFSLTSLRPLQVPEIIVDKIDTFSNYSKRLIEIYQQKLTNLEELKKSILEKAFKGQLN